MTTHKIIELDYADTVVVFPTDDNLFDWIRDGAYTLNASKYEGITFAAKRGIYTYTDFLVGMRTLAKTYSVYYKVYPTAQVHQNSGMKYRAWAVVRRS